MLKVHGCNDLSMIFRVKRERERERESKNKMENKDKNEKDKIGVIFGRATSDFAGLCSRVPRMGDVYPLKLYLGHFGESWRETEIQKRGDLRGRLRGGKCGKPTYIKGKINGRNYWGHTGRSRETRASP